MWSTPGGTILYQETVEDAVKRVVQEEVGIPVTIERYLGHAEYFEIEERGFGHSISLNFLCRVSGTLPQENEEGEQIALWTDMPGDHIREQVPFIEMGLLEWNKR
jgi:colanic acid biosynthesis protein WcaH